MQSTKPYLIRALHEWCVDQGLTPYLSVSVDAATRVPHEFIKNGEIVLNIGLEATNHLHLGNEEITFQGRFAGRVFPVAVPVARVAAIYARESSEGMAFEVTDTATPSGKSVAKPSVPLATADAPETEAGKGSDPAVSPRPTSPAPEHPAPAGRPALTRIK